MTTTMKHSINTSAIAACTLRCFVFSIALVSANAFSLLQTKPSKTIIPLRQSTNNENVNDTDTASPSSAAASESLIGKTVYQRSFHRISPALVAAQQQQLSQERDENNNPNKFIPNPMVVEERLRYQVLDPENHPDVVSPVGPRTLLVRDGQVEEGRIGDVLATVHLGKRHTGQLQAWRSTLATALCLSRQPTTYLHDAILQLAASAPHDGGMATLLACLCAAVTQPQSTPGNAEDDILTVPHASTFPWPETVSHVTLTDSADADLEAMAAQLHAAGVPTDKVTVEPLEWNVRSRQRSFNQEYPTIVLSDLSYTVPESTALAHTVAHALEASGPYFVETTKQNLPLPRLVHVVQYARDSVSYLQRVLQEGYRMNVDNDVVSVEHIQFVIQTIDTLETPSTEQEDTVLDELPLQVLDSHVTDYRVLTATHHPDYTGGGSGEYFFPMETGLYEERQRSNPYSGNALERDNRDAFGFEVR